ncbi:hypothetical protein R5R35_000051 [Gryllus longicercus]|uniref:Golgin-84 n=1 Tax=Gryllus longicercus TaxID=2509291 RepID=A0AAN9Z581_9ORTH
MAWLKGLAGKAEDFLNQIDQNAAVALQGDKKISSSKETLLTEVTWESQTPNRDILSKSTNNWSPVTPATIPTVRSTPNLNNLSPARSTPKKQNDEELISFLNSSEPIPKVEVTTQMSQSLQPEVNMQSETDGHTFVPVKFETLNEKPLNLVNSESSRSSSRRSSPQEIISDTVPTNSVQPTAIVTIDKPNGIIASNHVSDINTENEMLRNELRTLNNEMSLLLQRAKSAERECQNQQVLLSQLQERADLVNQLEQELLTARQQSIAFQEKLRSLQVENEKLVQSNDNNSGKEADKALQEEMEKIKSQHKQEITTMESRIEKMKEELQNCEQKFLEVKQQLSQRDNTTASLQQQLERARSEAQASREELDQYRLRAQRILQDKEKLINELRGEGQNAQDGQDDTIVLELQQLRQERELLREETAQTTARLQAVRDELLEAEKRLETCREQAAETQLKLQEKLAEERKRRQAAEEDCKSHGEELRSVQDELSRQRTLLATRVRERELELTRLRTQLAQRPTSPTDDELESRLHTLTQTLVHKQNTLETVTTEKNALRLQLEKMERKNEEMMTLLQQRQAGVINVNDTDDGMTRRVKRAYSSLDAVSIRTGVFLRRYPLARILVLCYMVLLHLWVMLVLFTYTPQAQ